MAIEAAPLLPSPAPASTKQPFSWTALGIFLGVGVYALYLWLWLIDGKAVGAAILLCPILVALTVPLFARVRRTNTGFDLAGLLLVGLVLRFGLMYYRFAHATDAWGYHLDGERLARYYRHLDFNAPTGGTVPGTGSMNAISGVIHVLTNSDFFAPFVVLTWLGFLGCWFLYRAFELAIPDGAHSRYAKFLMLWPSMLLWPSSLGKDAWMVFTIGIAALGAARIFRRVIGGYSLFTLGLFGASFVRPHSALLALLAFVVALLVGRRNAIRETITPGFIAKLVGLVLIVVLGSVLVARTQKLLDIQDFSSSSIDAATARIGQRTDVGNATFEAPNPRSPKGFVKATVTVLFRPFPSEAHGTEQLASSLEGLVLVVFTAASFRRLLTVPRRFRSQPYVTFAFFYVLIWILAFGIINNFGILARQRTQMLPFYFVLLCVSAVVSKQQQSTVPASKPAILR